jgi:MSHA biogenesis protein MshP
MTPTMTPASTRPSLAAEQGQRGFAAIAAIFLIVILAGLGGFMLTLSNSQQLTSAQDLQGTRAYWAARAGLEYGVAKVSATSACPPSSPATLPGGTATFDGGFTVTLTCTPQTYTEGGASVTMYSLKSVAKTSGSVGSISYVERSLSATLEK